MGIFNIIYIMLAPHWNVYTAHHLLTLSSKNIDDLIVSTIKPSYNEHGYNKHSFWLIVFDPAPLITSTFRRSFKERYNRVLLYIVVFVPLFLSIVFSQFRRHLTCELFAATSRPQHPGARCRRALICEEMRDTRLRRRSTGAVTRKWLSLGQERLLVSVGGGGGGRRAGAQSPDFWLPCYKFLLR